MSDLAARIKRASPVEVIGAIGVLALIVGIVIRVVGLDHRPLHHDESIHAMFSWYWLDHPSTGAYRYDPTYHGPFLYWNVRNLFDMFGVGVAQGRLFPLIFGIGVLALPLALARRMGRAGLGLAVSALAVSPLMVYHSRFLAHDMPTIFCCLASVIGAIGVDDACRQGRYSSAIKWGACVGVALGVLFSIKAIAHMWVVLAGSYLLFAWVAGQASVGAMGSLGRSREERRALMLASFVGIAIWFVVYAFFQTSVFRFPAALWDGIGGKVVQYWWSQHSAERLRGPAIFHARSLLVHELPIAVALTIASAAPFGRYRWGRVALMIACVVVLGMVAWPWNVAPIMVGPLTGVAAFFKIARSCDLALYLACALFGLVGTVLWWSEDERFGGFLNYWTWAAMAMFTFVGEKVPWLTVHVLVPATLFSAWWVGRWVTRVDFTRWRSARWVTILALVCVLYQGRLTWFVNHVKDGAREDLLSQVHNSTRPREVVDWMRRVSVEIGESPETMRVALIGEPTWAHYFYLTQHRFRAVKFALADVTGDERFIITDRANEAEIMKRVGARPYTRNEYDLNGWFVPENAEMNWLRWTHYALERDPPGGVGGVGGARFVVIRVGDPCARQSPR